MVDGRLSQQLCRFNSASVHLFMLIQTEKYLRPFTVADFIHRLGLLFVFTAPVSKASFVSVSYRELFKIIMCVWANLILNTRRIFHIPMYK